MMHMNRSQIVSSASRASLSRPLSRPAPPSRVSITTNALSKSEVSNMLAEELKIDKTTAQEAVSALLSIITSSVASGEDVTFVGFGSFKSKDRAARTGRNPKTGEPLSIPAKKAITFTPGKALKEKISGIVTTPKPKAPKAPKAKSASSVPAPKPVVLAAKIAPKPIVPTAKIAPAAAQVVAKAVAPAAKSAAPAKPKAPIAKKV